MTTTATTRPKPGTKADLIERLELAEQLIGGIIRMVKQGMASQEIAERAEAALAMFIARKEG